MRGGYRERAGRKHGFAAKAAEESRKIFAEAVLREINPIIDTLIDSAKKGNVSAARELLDRAFGKAVSAPLMNESTHQPLPILLGLIEK